MIRSDLLISLLYVFILLTKFGIKSAVVELQDGRLLTNAMAGSIRFIISTWVTYCHDFRDRSVFISGRGGGGEDLTFSAAQIMIL